MTARSARLLPLPLAGEGWGEGCCDLQYFFQYRFGLKQYIVVPESKSLKAQSRHVVAALLIVRDTLISSVLATSKLYNQRYFNTNKVRKIMTDSVLTAKFQVAKLPGAQP